MTQLQLRMKQNVADEFRTTIKDVVEADSRHDAYAKLLHDNLSYRYTPTMMIVSVKDDYETLNELAETLESYASGPSSLHPEARFRCGPFIRMAEQCRNHINLLEEATVEAIEKASAQ